MNEEDLIGIVAKLAELYTSKESTSISFATAEQLMEAALFCIQEYQNDIYTRSTLNKKQEICRLKVDELSVMETYEKGRELVVRKVHKAKRLYDVILDDFNSYRNRAYEDTIVVGMPSFFLYYQVDLNPQDKILSLDYPTLQSVERLKGVDAIYQYLQAVYLEQKFLHAFDVSYIEEVLSFYHENYEELFINLPSIILRNIVGSLLCRKPITKEYREKDYMVIKEFLRTNPKEEVKRKLKLLIEEFLRYQFKESENMIRYFAFDLKDFVSSIYCAYEHNQLSNVFVL